MATGRRHAAAGQDEILERGQVGIEAVECGFQPLDIGIVDHRHAGYTKFPAQIEQIVLRLDQRLAHWRRNFLSQHHADRAVELIDGAVSGHPRRILRHTRAIAEARSAVVAGFCINFA